MLNFYEFVILLSLKGSGVVDQCACVLYVTSNIHVKIIKWILQSTSKEGPVSSNEERNLSTEFSDGQQSVSGLSGSNNPCSAGRSDLCRPDVEWMGRSRRVQFAHRPLGSKPLLWVIHSITTYLFCTTEQLTPRIYNFNFHFSQTHCIFLFYN